MGYLNKPISWQVSEEVTLGKQEVGLISIVMGHSFNEAVMSFLLNERIWGATCELRVRVGV